MMSSTQAVSISRNNRDVPPAFAANLLVPSRLLDPTTVAGTVRLMMEQKNPDAL